MRQKRDMQQKKESVVIFLGGNEMKWNERGKRDSYFLHFVG